MKVMTGTSRAVRTNILETEFKQNKSYPGGFDETMSVREAMLILQLKSNKDPDTVKTRHKKLIIKNHPDRGKFLVLSIQVAQL